MENQRAMSDAAAQSHLHCDAFLGEKVCGLLPSSDRGHLLMLPLQRGSAWNSLEAAQGLSLQHPAHHRQVRLPRAPFVPSLEQHIYKTPARPPNGQTQIKKLPLTSRWVSGIKGLQIAALPRKSWPKGTARKTGQCHAAQGHFCHDLGHFQLLQ